MYTCSRRLSQPFAINKKDTDDLARNLPAYHDHAVLWGTCLFDKAKLVKIAVFQCVSVTLCNQPYTPSEEAGTAHFS